MIYRSLIVTDQSYEVSCHDKNFVLCPDRSYEVSGHDKNFVLCPMRFSCPAQG